LCKRGRDVAVTGLDRGVKGGRGAAVTRLVDRGESVPREEPSGVVRELVSERHDT
jgi:hypothetical protein